MCRSGFADPLGAGVERAYAVWHHARQLGLERSWLEHAMTACWSEGVDLASDEGLFSVAERVGLALPDVRESLNSEAWRAAIEANMARHEAAGFWGVPCYAYGDLRTWGQDRLVLVEREILRRAAGA